MNVLVPFSLLLIFWCYFVRNNPDKASRVFFIGMVITCIFASIRYEFGPDYFNYRGIYYGLRGEDVDSYGGKGSAVEKAFLYFLQLFPSFTLFVAFVTVTWFIANIYIFKKYIPSEYYWILIIFLVYNPIYMLQSFVAMRTTLCATLFVLALYFLIKGKRLYYVAIIFIGSLFHSSSLLLVSLVFLNKKNTSVLFSTPFLFMMGGVSLISFAAGENVFVQSFLNFLTDNVSELERYSGREISGVGQSVFSLIFRIISIVILCYVAISGRNEQDPQYIILYKVGFIYALFQVVFGQSLVSDRFMSILCPVFITIIIRSFQSNQLKNNIIVFLLIIIPCLYIFMQKMGQSYSESFKVFHTVFSAPYIP